MAKYFCFSSLIGLHFWKGKVFKRSGVKFQMPENFEEPAASVGEMHKRRELMADGHRYIIYYTFGEHLTDSFNAADTAATPSEVAGDV